MTESLDYRPDLEADPGSLEEEIRLLRYLLRETMRKISEKNDDSGIRTWTNLINAVSATTARLTVLLKTQQALSQSGSDAIAAALLAALEEIDSENAQLEAGGE